VCGWCAEKKGGQVAQSLGRSRGGFSTKIHVVVDALGNPLNILLSGGHRHDISQAEALLADCLGEHVIADRGYDFDGFLTFLLDQEVTLVVPSRKNRLQQRTYDVHLYKERHLVECFINKIKQYRRVFSRFEKLASRYLAFVKLAATLVWLR
jgi:transposase